MSTQAVYLDELFLSVQGEAAQSGRAHLFARLSGCPLRCFYCDTPRSWVRREFCEVQFPNGEVKRWLNPVSLETFQQGWEELLQAYGCKQVVLAITGGEPLEQTEFLEIALRQWPDESMLETAGVFPERLQQLLPALSSVSLDRKLSSTLKEPADCLAPLACLEILQQSATPFWVKLVYLPDTPSQEISEALSQISHAAPGCQVWLQPATAIAPNRAPIDGKRMLKLLLDHSHYPLELRAQPQGHPFWGIQ